MSEEKKQDSSLFSGTTFFDFLKQYQGLPNQFQGLYNSQLKNIQSINNMQQTSIENFQEIAHKQNEIFSQIMQQTTHMANDMMVNSDPEEKLRKNVINFQKGYEQALSNAKEISELIKKSNAQTNKILRKRASESLDEIKTYTQKQEA